jgi:hypothetical protein
MDFTPDQLKAIIHTSGNLQLIAWNGVRLNYLTILDLWVRDVRSLILLFSKNASYLRMMFWPLEFEVGFMAMFPPRLRIVMASRPPAEGQNEKKGT